MSRFYFVSGIMIRDLGSYDAANAIYIFVPAVTAASRAVLCVMGLVSFTHCLTFLLTPSPFDDPGSKLSGNVQSGHVSRFLLSENSRHGSLDFRSEADFLSDGVLGDLTSSQRASPTFWQVWIPL